MKKFAIAVALVLFSPTLVMAVDVGTPMKFEKRFSGDQNLGFTRGGEALRPAGAKMSYRVIRSKAEWKRVWSYLYDNSLDVDFSKHRVLAIYKSPANGGFSIKPKLVDKMDKRLKVAVDVTWNGKTSRSHPFLFLVVDKFRGLDVEETFLGPPGKAIRYP